MKTSTVMKIFLALLITLLVFLIACNPDMTPPVVTPPDKTTHTDILHTNDIHGHLGNMPRLASSVALIYEEIDKEKVLLLDAGDVFSGSIYGTVYQGQASLWFMNRLGYDAMCLGNHEFDYGLECLYNFAEGAQFDIVSSNLEFKKASALDDEILPWVIIRKNNESYGVFGLLTKETSEIANTGADILINNRVSVAREMVDELERMGINKVIALTHIGWDQDIDLALEVDGIDIIIGGHTHTIPDVYPYVVDPQGSPTLIVQAGEHASYLGHLSVDFNAAGIIIDWDGSKLLKVDECPDEDATFVAKLAEYDAPIQATMAKNVGNTLVYLDGERASIRSQETNLGNLVADSMLYDARHTGADIAIINSGGIRASIPVGDITLGQTIDALPFDNYLVTFNLTGEQIISALENGVSQVEEVQGRFPQVAGLRFTWDPKAIPGSRIVSVEIEKDGVYEPINPVAVYRMVTNDFLFEGGDSYTVFARGTDLINLGNTDYEVLAEYIAANSPISPQVEGRITHK